jgi:hypothetical protein
MYLIIEGLILNNIKSLYNCLALHAEFNRPKKYCSVLSFSVE